MSVSIISIVFIPVVRAAFMIIARSAAFLFAVGKMGCVAWRLFDSCMYFVLSSFKGLLFHSSHFSLGFSSFFNLSSIPLPQSARCSPDVIMSSFFLGYLFQLDSVCCMNTDQAQILFSWIVPVFLRSFNCLN